MKKLITLLCLLIIGINVFGQETPPSGLKAVNAQFYIHLPDSTIWQNKGTPYGYHRVGKWSDFSSFATLTDLSKKADSARLYGTMLPLYLLKSDSANLWASKYWVEHQPHTWYGDQTVNGNVIISGNTHGLIMDGGAIINGADAFVIQTGIERNGLQVFYYGSPVLDIAGPGHAADIPYSKFYVPISAPKGFDPSSYPGSYDIAVRLNSGAGPDEGLFSTIPLSTFPTTGTGGNVYTKTQVDSLSRSKQDTATNTLQTVTYRSRYSRNSTVIGSKNLQTAPATLTTYLLSDSYGLPTGPYSAQLGAVQRLTNVLRHNLTNYSISGTTKAQLTPGDSSAVNRLYRIPTYNSSTMGYYVVWYPVNDCFNSVDTAVYRAANVTIANNLVSKGWPANRVIWGGQTYYTANSTNLNIPKYNYVDSTVAKTYGFIYVNTYEAGNYLHLSDGIHGNNTYNEIMGARFIRAINATSGADLTVKGQLGADGVTVYLPQTNTDKTAIYAISDSSATQTNTNPLIRLDLYSNNSSFQPILRFNRNSGSVNSKRFTPSSAITPNGMRLWGIQGGGNGGSGDLLTSEIYASVNGTPDATHVPTDINFAVQGLNTTNRQVAFSVVNNGSISATGSVSNGTSTLVSGASFSPTLTAGINNAREYGLRVTPTFVTGGFTGVTNYSIGVNAPIVPTTTQNVDNGTSTWNWATIWGTGLSSTTNALTLSAGGANSMFFQTNGTNRATLSSTGLWQWGNYVTAGALVNDASGNVTSAAVLPETTGGTGFASYTIGDILAANTTTSLSKIHDVATGNVLRSGGVGVLPAYGKVNVTTDVTPGTANQLAGTNAAGTALEYKTVTGSVTTGQTVTNGAGSITLSNDTTLLRTVANSVSLAGLQTKLNGYATNSNPTFSGLLRATNYYSTSSTPTIAAGANIGTGGTVSIVGNNQDGIITVNTGVGATTGVLCTITMSGSFAYPNSCTPVITHLSGPLITGDVTIDTPNSTTWGVYMNGGVISSSTYRWTYHNGGY